MSNDTGYGGNLFVGVRYEWRPASEIAKLIRADIKAAVANGALPGKEEGFTYGARSDSFAGGQAVRIWVNGPEGWAKQEAPFPLYNDPWGGRTWSAEAHAIGYLLYVIGTAYIRDDSNSMIDYFDTSCYISVSQRGGSSLPRTFDSF